MADQIIALYARAKNMDYDKVDITGNLDWNVERSNYTQHDFAARDIMLTVIDAMEQAMEKGASQDVRQQSLELIENMQGTVQSAISSLDTQIDGANTGIIEDKNNLSDSQEAMNGAPAGTDLSSYQNAVDRAQQIYEGSIARREELINRRRNYQDALERVEYYISILNISGKEVPSYSIGANLREIQQELFGQDPDSDSMMDLAKDIFGRLQNSIDMETGVTEDSNYNVLLTEMHQFVRQLENYDSIKGLDSKIQEMINDLSTKTILSLNQSKSNWIENWQKQFNDLKSQISGLPVYTLMDRNAVLESFDRAASIRRLDDTIRDYLTKHNLAQQGLVYLKSPYRGSAIFSLIIALLLDIAAFVTGFMIDRADGGRGDYVEESCSGYVGAVHKPSKEKADWDMTRTLEWNAIPPLNRYTFLTGDHQYLDGTMTYKVIENGKIMEMEYADMNLQAGFYCWKAGAIYQVSPAELSYKGTPGGPRDGVYENAVLQYEDQLLTIVLNTQSCHLGTVAPYTPVYCLSKEEYESFPAKEIQDMQGDMIVISLNQIGTRIIAIYVIKDDSTV